MGAIASQITSLTIVYSTVYSDADQRKHQSSATLAFVQGIHRGPVNSPHKGPVTWKMFPFDDVIIMTSNLVAPISRREHLPWAWMVCLPQIDPRPSDQWASPSVGWGTCPSATSSGKPLQWRHHGHDGVSNHQPHNCLLNRLFRPRSKKTSKLRVTGICVGNSPVTGEFPAQMASNAENVSIWWRHHAGRFLLTGLATVVQRLRYG